MIDLGLQAQDKLAFLAALFAVIGISLWARERPGRAASFDRVLLVAVCLASALLAARRLRTPAVGYDEALYVRPALCLLRRDPAALGAALPASFTAFGLPLMVMTYAGCPVSYVLAALIPIFGLSTLLLRLTALAIAAGALALLLALCSEFFPEIPLWAPAAAIGLNSLMLITARQGLYVDASIHWLALAAALRWLARWRKGRGARDAFLCGAALGLGLWAKIIFVWFLPAAAGAIVWACWPDGPGLRRALRWWAAGVAAGAAPLLVYNLASGGGTVREILASLDPAHLLPGAAPNSAFLANLAGRWRDLVRLFSGDFCFPTFRSRAWLGLAQLGLLLYGAFAFEPGQRRLAYRGAVLLAAAFLAGSTFTVSCRDPYHLMPILPVLLALSAVALARLVPNRHALLALCLLLQWPHWVHEREYVDYYSSRDAGANDSRSLAELSRYLVGHGMFHVVATDWGLSNSLIVESGGRILASDALTDPLQAPIERGETAVCYAQVDVAHPNRQGCARLFSAPGLKVEPLATIRSIRGYPWYTVARVVSR